MPRLKSNNPSDRDSTPGAFPDTFDDRMAASPDYDLVVIGAGPAGEKAAAQAAAAAALLGLSQRQTERLCQKYRSAGPMALVSRKRGRPSNRQIPGERRDAVLALVRARYSDFGPTLAREKLLKCHGLRVSTETLRKWKPPPCSTASSLT